MLSRQDNGNGIVLKNGPPTFWEVLVLVSFILAMPLWESEEWERDDDKDDNDGCCEEHED